MVEQGQECVPAMGALAVLEVILIRRNAIQIHAQVYIYNEVTYVYIYTHKPVCMSLKIIVVQSISSQSTVIISSEDLEFLQT